MLTELYTTATGRILVSGDDKCFDRMSRAFKSGIGPGFLALIREESSANTGKGYLFFRDTAKKFTIHLLSSADCPKDLIGEVLNGLHPDVIGADFITADFLKGCFAQYAKHIGNEADKVQKTPVEFIRALKEDWKDLGKVMFHLATNKKDTDGTKPFVFLATYLHKISETGVAKHLPLGTALAEYAEDKKTLLTFLSPLKAAAVDSPFLKSLLDDNRIFKPCFFTANETADFLCSTEIFRLNGIPVHYAGLWEKSPKKLKMEMALDAPPKGSGKFSAWSLVRFSAWASVGGQRLTDAELAEILNKNGRLIRIKGEWVEADTEKIRQLLNRWRAAGIISGKTDLNFVQALHVLSRAKKLQGENVPEVDSEICEVHASGQFKVDLQELLDSMKKALPPLPERTGALLRPYQLDGVRFLYNMLNAGMGVCLADDMGLGKTLQMITCIQLLKRDGAFNDFPALIVLPASLQGNWTDEFRKFAPELKIGNLHPSSPECPSCTADIPDSYFRKYDVVLITYSLVTRREVVFKHEFPLVVLDEAQQIKNPASKISRAIRSLRAKRRVAMTGTPIENSLNDLWSIFDFVYPTLLGSEEQFHAFVEQMESAKPQADYSPLRNLVRPFILRRLKTDKSIIADLPGKIERCERTPLTVVQAKFYQRTVNALQRELENTDDEHRSGVILSYLLQFKQICNHPSQFSGNNDYPAEKSGKMLRLGRLADYIAKRGEKMLVFTQFREITEVLHEFLTMRFHRAGLILHGGTPVEKRMEYVRQFQSEDGPPFFIVSLKAGGTGLNLTAANHVVHFDRWWNPAVENQATDRAYRIGQRQTVFVHKFVSPGTIEEKIEQLISSKRSLAEDFLEKGTVKLLTEMDNQQLLDFFKLDEHAVDEDERE